MMNVWKISLFYQRISQCFYSLHLSPLQKETKSCRFFRIESFCFYGWTGSSWWLCNDQWKGLIAYWIHKLQPSQGWLLIVAVTFVSVMKQNRDPALFPTNQNILALVAICKVSLMSSSYIKWLLVPFAAVTGIYGKVWSSFLTTIQCLKADYVPEG